MKPESLDKLRQIIEREVPTAKRQMIYKDHFALGCFLYAQGHKAAGEKLIRELLADLGYDGRKTYFNSLLSSLAGNEAAYAIEIQAHAEINSLVCALHT